MRSRFRKPLKVRLPAELVKSSPAVHPIGEIDSRSLPNRYGKLSTLIEQPHFTKKAGPDREQT